MGTTDVAIIGGGVMGASAAAFLAEAGRSVTLFERADIAAGASGRNSGVIQHPFDLVFAELYYESLVLYRELSLESDGFALPDRPPGLLMLAPDGDAVAEAAAAINASAPELEAEVVSPEAVATLEPVLAAGLWACRLTTGYPVTPAAATWAFARRAERAGARLVTGTPAEPVIDGGRAVGIRLGTGETLPFEQVLVAAGPWTPSLVPGWAGDPPIRSLWGVVVGTSLPNPPRQVVEELGIDRPGMTPERLFSLVTAGGISSVGSTFLADEPDAESFAADLLSRGATFVPALAGVRAGSVRACARPVSFDGRPLIGPVPGVEGLYVCAGHGPWGISTGPGSALLVTQQMLGLAPERPNFSPARMEPREFPNTEFA